MNIKLYKMTSNKDKTGGLPNYFKKIGGGFILLAIVAPIVINLSEFHFADSSKEIARTIVFDLFILGLLLVTLSKDKVEDEMTLALKLKSMAGAFVFGAVFTLVYPFLGLIFNEPLKLISSTQLIMTILFVHIITYYGLKRFEAK
jgi:cytochrome bd-type quinol oxidase subunit 2